MQQKFVTKCEVVELNKVKISNIGFDMIYIWISHRVISIFSFGLTGLCGCVMSAVVGPLSVYY